jgi:uncharacterized membrane protein YphA (DoxX/SURF4 family)
MNRYRKSKNKPTIGGRSYFFNLLFVVFNLIGLGFVVLGSHQAFMQYFVLFSFIGYILMAITTAGLFIFEGRLMMAGLSRFLVGGVFIVSGLIKLNDPIGFSYKLEEYFQDGALAYRIKELFNAPGFSLEFLIGSALTISVIVCIAEIILGVLLILGGKIKLVSYLLLLMILFFTFLTWHTASCDPQKQYTDRDTYLVGSSIAEQKELSSKTNKGIKIISRDVVHIVIEEKKTPQCVSDCGCFGDALKGSVGRSLTAGESFWKDLVLLYLALWIFISQWIIVPNTKRQNVSFLIAETVLIGLLSWVFGWYLILLFSLVLLVGSLWVRRVGGVLLGNYGGVVLFNLSVCLILVSYILNYEPLKDYRPYAVGTRLIEKTRDGVEGKYESLIVYKNVRTGEEIEFLATSGEYENSRIWEDKEWKYLRMKERVIRPTRLPSITEQFNPSRAVSELGEEEMSLAFVSEQIGRMSVNVLKVEERSSGKIIWVKPIDYDTLDYPLSTFRVLDTVRRLLPELQEVSLREFILKGDRVIVLVARDIDRADWDAVDEYRQLLKECKKNDIPFIMICNGSKEQIDRFRGKYKFPVPAFLNDETELKVMARSNPSLMVVEKGRVKGKYAHRSTPDLDWLKRNILSER